VPCNILEQHQDIIYILKVNQFQMELCIFVNKKKNRIVYWISDNLFTCE